MIINREDKETKMYILFGGEHYYPGGGFYDYIGTSDLVQELKDHAKILEKKERYFDWWHIVDSDTWKIIDDSNNYDDDV